MKTKLIILSALLATSSAFAATTTHSSDAAVAEAHKGADTAKEKLHQSQNEGKELKLKAEHAKEGKTGTTGSKISEGSQKAWNNTKEGTEKAWDKTKQGSEELKNKVTN
ncbi:hypothetical protein [Erwinia sp. Leaf53]|uniref:hypothetical protein n=1 Tax=Erwinia sp. Leaf53 TaxID=1736225 RepID=UPI0006FB9845|nr:hypothetical protein [Erwinia sp. Leaf53]KQN61762.1 hypothetical protein ASF13_21565 [Erwinia sp. Leaf53]